MPREFFRDVLLSGDAPGRARRRWSMLPISVAAHAVIAAAIVIIPLAAEVDLPVPASWRNIRWVGAIAPPQLPARVPPSSHRPDRSRVAPTAAPSRIAPEPALPPPGGLGPMDEIPGALDVSVGPPVIDISGPGLPPAPPPVAPPAQPNVPRRVGHGIREPKKIVHVAPVYPELALRARVEGTVILEAIIDERGVVDHVRVLKSVPLLDAAAIEAVRAWRYTPTLLSGVPVPVLMTITVRFSLQK
jgi:protein TonB